MVIAVVGGVTVGLILLGLRALLAAINLVELEGSIPLWVAAIIAAVALGVGFLIGPTKAELQARDMR